ncbi:hypothetical protein [Candidatus Tisiphia endosymbiont of Xenochironomus xenolabis]|uniref:hypothetical protein n=1 Tax=unclassified Candidatus Tisiphia TaxID=2996318 RepID=UPI0035C911F7
MDVKTVLNEVIKEHCPFIHNNRLNALLDVAEGLLYSQNLSLKIKRFIRILPLGNFLLNLIICIP